MKIPRIKSAQWSYLAIAFAIPVVSLCIVLLCGSYEPFGNARALLYSDQYHQYYPFFVDFRRAILSGEGLLYNWSIGMGLDYIGLISYYLCSPLNLLSILLPESWMLEYFCLLTPIRLGLASMFFAIFLKKIFGKNDISIALFGSFYGLCAWALAYQWNVMWLDTFAMLPLVALGTVQLLKERRFLLYTVSLFLSVCMNYYIGLFTCIFVFLLFVCYEICRFRNIQQFFSDLFRIGVFTVLALGMTAIVELPTLAALQTTQSSVNNFPEGFKLNITKENTFSGLMDAMRQVAGNMGGGLTPSWKEGLPNLYCGTGSILLAFLYLTCKDVKIRDKICSVVLLLFFMISFIIRQLDYIWHGFHFTNMIPYRFSFLFSFVLLYMAYKAYLQRKNFKLWQIIVGAALSLGVLACSDKRTDTVFLAYNLVFLSLYLGVLLYPILMKKPAKKAAAEEAQQYQLNRSQRRKFSTAALAAIMAAEIAMNVVNFGVAYPYTGVSNYPKGLENMETVVEKMQEAERDTLFYRAEVTHSQTLNDSALNGYNGISTFTSSANVRVTEFMQALGFGAKNTYNRYCFEESSPIANLFLNIKYMIERDGAVERNVYFDDVYNKGNVYLLQNNTYLPLGFLAENQLANFDFSASGNTFDFQNRLLKAASGTQDNAWQQLQGDYLSISSKNVTISNTTASGFTSYQAGASQGTVTYTFNPDRAGFMCISLNLPKKNAFSVYMNNTLLYKETYSLPQCISVSDVVPGDVIEVRLTCKANEKSSMTVHGAILDERVFRSAYDVLNTSTLDLQQFTNTKVSGTISCNRDGLLYTSIPQNGNWHVEVDGSEVDIALVGDAMIGVPLTEGTHEVTFLYKNKAFSLGWKISLLCLVVLVGLTVIANYDKSKQSKAK